MTFKNPFITPKAQPGSGKVHLSFLPPSTQSLTTFSYQYPLKLISPDSHTITTTNSQTTHPITTIFLLNYGGGLLPTDHINLSITLDSSTRLALLTQGSTKIFKSESQAPLPPSAFQAPSTIPASSTSQIITATLHPSSSLCYLPDPCQPFQDSRFMQHQTFYVDPHGSSSLLVLDWVSEGRTARGEHWSFSSWKSRTEIRESNANGRLLLRDSVLLSDAASKTDGKAVLGTLIIYGPLFRSLGEFFMKEFRGLPRIGAKNWAVPKTPTIMEEGEGYFGSPGSPVRPVTPGRKATPEGLLWTAAQVRGFVMVKLGGVEIDETRRWLGDMLRREGSVEREFGHQALLCLK